MTDEPMKLSQEIALMVEVQAALSSTTAAKVGAIDKVLRSASPAAFAELATVKAMVDAAVKTERERCAALVEGSVYTTSGGIPSLEPVNPQFAWTDNHHKTIAAAIRGDHG